MKFGCERFGFVAWVAVVGSGLLAGCGGGDSAAEGEAKSAYKARPDSPNVVAAAGSHETSPVAAETPALPLDAEPDQVTRRYFDAVVSDDSYTAERLLSDSARSSFDSIGLQPTIPAPAGSEMRIGKTRYTTQRKDVAWVETIWTTIDSEGKSESTSEVMLKRSREGAWRVSGLVMSIGAAPVFFDFEDYVSLKTIHDSVGGEPSDVPSEGTRTADGGREIR